MLDRMAIWTQYFKIAGIIVFAIAIFMMHAKNFWVLVVSAALACCKHVSPDHVFAHSRKHCTPLLLGRFVNARFRAILSFVRWRIQKFNAAVCTDVLCSAFLVHRLVIACWRAVLGFVRTAGNVAEHIAALLTRCSNLHSSRKCETLSAAVHCGIFSVWRHREQ